MSSAAPRTPMTARKAPYMPTSAKAATGKRRTTTTNAAKQCTVGAKKGNTKAVASKRKMKAESTSKNAGPKNKVAKARARSGTTGSNKKQRVDNSEIAELIDDDVNDAPQPQHANFPPLQLSTAFETPMQSPHAHFGAPPQQLPFDMDSQQSSSDMQHQQRYVHHQQPFTNSLPLQQLPSNVLPQQRPMPPQQQPASMLSRQHSAPLPQCTMSPQQHSSNMLDQSHLSQMLPPQQSMPSRQRSPDMQLQQPSMPPQEVSPDALPRQVPSNVPPQQRTFDMMPQHSPSDMVYQHPSPDMSLAQHRYGTDQSCIANKFGADVRNSTNTNIFDQLVLMMITQHYDSSPESDTEVITSAQLDQCAYTLWSKCLITDAGQLVVHAAKYGSMYQNVKIRALGLMNLLPGWWFLREKLKAWLLRLDKRVDDAYMQAQFNQACAKADKIIRSRERNKKGEEDMEQDVGIEKFEGKAEDVVDCCYE